MCLLAVPRYLTAMIADCSFLLLGSLIVEATWEGESDQESQTDVVGRNNGRLDILASSKIHLESIAFIFVTML